MAITTPNINPIQQAMDHYDTVYAELTALRETHDHLLQEHKALANRYDHLTENYKRALRERDLFQTYAIGLRTRLQGVKENILAAERETHEWVKLEIESKKEGLNGHPPQTDDPKLPDAPKLEAQSPRTDDQRRDDLAAEVVNVAAARQQR